MKKLLILNDFRGMLTSQAAQIFGGLAEDSEQTYKTVNHHEDTTPSPAMQQQGYCSDDRMKTYVDGRYEGSCINYCEE